MTIYNGKTDNSFALSSFIPVTVAFCAGIIWAGMASVPLVVCTLITIILMIRLLLLKRGSLMTTSLLLAFFFMVGAIHATLALRPPDQPSDISVKIRHRQEASLAGTLTQSPTFAQGRSTLVMASEQLYTPNSQAMVSGLVKLSMQGPPPPDLIPGDRFIARALLAPVSGYNVPGAFDYRAYLAYQGIRITGWISSPLLIKKIISLPPPSFLKRLKFLPEIIRLRIGRRLDAVVPAQAGIYKALLIGDRAGLAPRVLETFKACGIVHLLAISGIHMGLLALSLTFMFTWMLKRSQWLLLHLSVTKTAALLALGPLIIYALIAGFHPPAVRSLIMVMVFIGALLVDRQWSIGNNTAIAALIILAINPALLFTASFQLSFAAMAAIALFVPSLKGIIKASPPRGTGGRNMVRRFLNWCLFSLLISLAAMAGTAPILLYHFNRLSLISPLTTLLVEPLLCLWSLIFGLTGCLCLPIPAVAAPLFKTGALGISAAVKIAAWFAAWPVSIWLPSPSWLQICAWFTGLILVSLWLKKGAKPLIIGAFALCVLLLVLPQPQPGRQMQKTEVAVLDVGHGSAIVLQLPGRHTVLIDGGRRQSGRGSSFNAGQDLIAPFLWHRQIRTIDAVVVTHPHADHYNGLPFILQRFRPKTIWINGTASDEPGFANLLTLARRLNIAVRVPHAGDLLFSQGEVKLTVLANLYDAEVHSAETAHQKRDARRNNQGLVLHLSHGRRSFFFTGDIEHEAEDLLLTTLPVRQLQADVIIVPHHGSRTSSGPAFIRAVNPRYAVISAEKDSEMFPAAEVVRRYRKLGAKVLNTARQGSLFFETDGVNLTVSNFFRVSAP